LYFSPKTLIFRALHPLDLTQSRGGLPLSISRHSVLGLAVVLAAAFAALQLKSGPHPQTVVPAEATVAASLVGARFSASLPQAATSPSPQTHPGTVTTGTQPVNAQRITNADSEPGNWLTHGRTYSEQRFSPLKQIDDHNISQLALAWHFDLDTHRGQEATPLVIDGVMYFTTEWSKVIALNAATGSLLWKYDPKVPPEWAINACCDVVNRGVAAWEGKVFVGTLDGRLIALDASTGKPLWDTETVDRRFRYSITGAPRVVKGKVIIGNAGAELGVRGYVSAYDAGTGKLVWRFYTVPGDPAKPFESPVLAKAAKTWSGEWWKNGGGATVWDSMSYDSKLDLLYIGTGNGDPWSGEIRNPHRQANLFASSVIALKPDTGQYVWHYQENPGDEWDYDSASQMILADLTIDGRLRQVLLHAPKNGFFYVLDRATGQLLSAKPFTSVTWASGVDLQTGLPIESPTAEYAGAKQPVVVSPGPSGAHTWHPMSFNPQTGLVYVPVLETGFPYKTVEHFIRSSTAYNNGIDFVAAGLPQDPQVKKDVLASIKGHLVAWDPVKQAEVWRVDHPGPVNSGILSTVGNLVFQGTGLGQFEAFRADTGEKLWSAPTQSGVIAGPISYSVNGQQYVAILAGWGGVWSLAAGELALQNPRMVNVPRMLVFCLGGKASLPPAPEFHAPVLNPPPATASAETTKKGEELYQGYCANCHGDVAVSGGVLPDLRYSSSLTGGLWFDIVLGGQLRQRGMVSFAKELSRQDAAAIRSYVVLRANQSKAATSLPPANKP
jgi:quinohemoprotein ethanol dehydrogenase